MCSGREFHIDGAETEKARDETLLVISDGTIWPWEETMDVIQYCTKYRDTIQSQRSAVYTGRPTVNHPRLMQHSHCHLRTLERH